VLRHRSQDIYLISERNTTGQNVFETKAFIIYNIKKINYFMIIFMYNVFCKINFHLRNQQS